MTPALAAAVVVAGAIGALARYGVSVWFTGRSAFPIAVLVVNVLGSAIGGVVLALAIAGDVPPEARLVILTGLCGGLTTFSTFSVETIELVAAGKARTALASVAANLVLGIGAAALGYLLVR